MTDQIVINPTQTAKAAVIWLHGLGADGHDFVDVIPLLRLPDALAVRFILPHAPVMPVTLNGGIPMRAWFDLKGLSADEMAPDEAGIIAARQRTDQLIAAQIDDGISADHIVLVGFSQGGAVALDCGLRYPHKLAGILGLSTCLPLADKLSSEASAANKTTPIALMHGTEDVVLPMSLGVRTCEILTQLGYQVSWHPYPMPHSVCPQQIIDISAWLQVRLS